MLRNKVDSIIFDLDGTMWDSSDAIVEIWNGLIKDFEDIECGITKEELKAVVGVPVVEIVRTLFPYLKEERVQEFTKLCCKRESEYLSLKGGILFEGLEETLMRLITNYKLFIVSNCQDGYIESFFKAHHMGKYFVDFEHPGRTGLSKGENIKKIIEKNGLKCPIYIGDTEGDRRAARLAGVPFIYASYGFGDVKTYEGSIEKFSDILELEILK